MLRGTKKRKISIGKRPLKKKKSRRSKRRKPTRRKVLNILYIVHSFYPETYTGTEKFVFNLARSMQSKGHRVKVVTYSDGMPESYSHTFGEVLYKEYEYEGIPVLAYRHKHMDPAQFFEIGNMDLTLFAQKVIKKEKPTLIHIGHPMRAMDFIQISKRLGIKYIITLTDFWFVCPAGTMLQKSNALCNGPDMGRNCLTHCQIPNVQQRLSTHVPLLRAASRVFSPSASLAGLVSRNLPDIHVEVQNHGINYDTIRRNERVYQPGDSLTLFYGGSLNTHKGVHLILQAMSMIPSDRLQLKIYGSGPSEYTASLQQAAASDDRISFCGLYSENDIQQIYQEVDIALVPSIWYENYPLALHEALASHVPALVSDIGGMAEKVQDGFNGLTFRVGDAEHLAQRIVELLDNPTLLNVFKANMNQVEIPSIQQEAVAYEGIYHSVAR
ncbi:glycosyltransferase [Paenibacillus wynnii]|uniref:glycosyltransferase n=1 Tax=Paenibacillus wynnii TaxID=268407 RepID=UPI0012F85ED3|nr:glycosyltransferase [Paenibacillus wynnii]